MMSPESSSEPITEPAQGGQETENTVEKFDGKILYNPDGSTYIIEDPAELGDNELPKQEGSFYDEAQEEGSEERSYPQIANAHVVSRSTAYYNALYGQAVVKLLQERNVPETPVVHSYRVYSARTGSSQQLVSSKEPEQKPSLPSLVPVKPILMCFICKLSFGCAKTFANHCLDLHSVSLSDEEESILDAKNTSAILQYVGKDQEVTLSFLEPFVSSSSSNHSDDQSSPTIPMGPPTSVSTSAGGPLNNLVSLMQNSNKSSSSSQQPPLSPGAIASFLSVVAAAQQAKSSLPKVPTVAEDKTIDDSIIDHNAKSPTNTSFTRYSSPSPSSTSAFPGANLPGNSSMTATNANMLQGTTIGACPDHINGRPTGEECTKCDLILSSSRMAGGTGWNVSRNSCKTLKCPKCNWHYKYQETLEIHMKEKHPESETTCIYCITGQQHPRLARGETYTCGYKPYRCEVCNYSTTTKGNLSIHMQSDKHLNNMQELQNGGVPASLTASAAASNQDKISPGPSRAGMALPPTMSPSSKTQSPSPKPTWRCDVCNYDTNVARNLRIHMTSEKHTHNMMALSQQNAKMLQQMMQGASGDPSKLLPPLPQPGGLLAPPTSSEAALADLAFNQAVLAQMMSGGNLPAVPPSNDLNLAALMAAAQNNPEAAMAAAAAHAANQESPEALQEKQNQEDQNTKFMFSCCVCRDFGCDSLDELSAHLNVDRSRTREHEVSLFIGGHYLCQLCNYKTNLKANFQLHCKTDKHLQRLSHVNHIKEGGPSNEWKLRFLTSINPVELRCNACDFYTNSPHKLQVHVANQQHQAASVLFNHLQKSEVMIEEEEKRSYHCILCKFHSPSKPGLMAHVRTMKHLQMEQIHQLQKKAEGNLIPTEIGDIFQVLEAPQLSETENNSENSKEEFSTAEKGSTGVTSPTGLGGAGLEGGDEGQESTQSEPNETSAESGDSPSADPQQQRCCPLCSEKFPSQDRLESHAMSVHSVNSEGLQRLQSLINGSHWLNKKEGDNNNLEEEKKAGTSSSSGFSYSLEKYMDPNRPFKCDVCKESFTQKNILLVHYNSVSHLHRLKKSMQDSNSTPEKSASTKSSALEALLGNIRGEKNQEVDEVKPFKCNICKVAYSQGSTLDIHIRSVLHQTKASKLQELMMTGQIDMSKPLIEQPEPQQLQDQHKKMIQDMLLSPKSLNSTGSSNPQTSPNLRSSSPDRLHSDRGHSSPQSSSPLVNKESSPEVQQQENIMKNLLSNLTSTPNDKEENRPDLKNILQNYVSELKRQRETTSEDDQAGLHFSEAKKAREQQNGGEDSRPASPPSSPQPQQQPNLQEMQEALQRAMMGAQLQQMNPMMMQMASLNPLIAMNLYPPLIPPNLLQQKQGQAPGPPNSDLLSQLQANPLLGGMDPKLLALMSAAQRQQESPSPAAAPKNLAQMMGLLNPPVSSAEVANKNFLPPGFPAAPPTFRLPRPNEAPGGMILPQQPMGQDQGKRARTRISDDQLKILRANFDINNSPTEDTLNKMSAQTGLPLKVIKHWFRNTLFKERQKNKDSPYNFNNPPSTKLNLEEYEKTGEPQVTPLNRTDQEEYIKQEAAKKLEMSENQGSNASKKEMNNPTLSIKSESISNASKVPTIPIVSSSPSQIGSVNETISSSSPIEAANSAALSNLSRILGPHLTPGALAGPGGQPPPLLPNFPAFPITSGSMTPPMPEYLTTLARQNPRPQSPQSVGSGQGKRANRTRFTDYQIKVLQEFFENNAYPKDDDLEYLSKLLGLSPRVIVVWFQNARQKARKIYENQPPPGEAGSSPGGGGGGPEGDEASGRFSRTQNCNYQCKKCLLVFQRYYELIRHQKQHCYKEEDARRSAQAQKAAAVAAAQFVGPPPALVPITSEESRSSVGDDRSLTSPALTDKDQEESTPRGTPLLNFPPHTPFGILQQQALQQQQLQQQMNQNNSVIKENADNLSGDEFDDFESNASSPGSKRKLSDNDAEIDDETLQHREKRLRTTISPEQLDFLYQKYQMESNPSRKMLETIATETGLRKRVVQVWFQNTRARERKGQFNGNAQTKTQDFLKVRSALEAPLGIPKHPAVQDNNIVDIEGETTETENDNENHENNGNNHNQASVQNSTPGFDLQSSMRKYYEDTMKRFMSDLADQKQQFPSEPHQALDLSSSFNAEDSDPHDDSETSQRNSSSEANNKRFRTQMSGLQVKMMKAIFEAYKTPTMTECSSLGREIGLQKRVVQVWFQNARAKEKRARLQLQQATGREPEPPMPPEQCIVCPGFNFGPRFAVQDHLFTKAHLDHLKVALEQGRYDPESPGHAMAQAAAAISQQNGSSPDPQTSLSMLQINQMNNSSPHELFDIPSAKNPRMLMQV